MTGRGGSRCKPRTSSRDLHSLCCYLHCRAAVGGGLGDRSKDLHVVYALVERGIARQRVRLINAGDLLEERACLENEAIVLANAYTRCIHRQAASEVRVVWTDDHPAIAARISRTFVQHELEFTGAFLLPLRGALVTEDFKCEAVRVAGGDARDLRHADAVLQLGAEAGVVVVLDRLIGIADRSLAMTDDDTKWHRTLRDRGCESSAAYLLYVSAKELDEVREVTADVGERTRTRSALVPPTHRPLRVTRVVAPVAAVDVQDATQSTRGDQFAESSDAWRPAECKADADHRVGAASQLRHGASILEVVTQRLLAEHMLASGDQPLHHLTMQKVGHDHADNIDVGILRNRL